MLKERRIPLATLVMCAVTATASGQPAATPDASQAPMTLEQLMSMDVERVFGASRFQQSVLEAPASVSIVTRDDIERFGYRTLADILRVVRGFYTSNDRNYSYVGVAGFSRPGDYNTRVLLLIDGHRLNDNVFDQAMIGTEFPLDVELIDRVEVVRGATSSLYGTSAFFGIVNVITRAAGDLGRFSGSVEAGSLGTRRVRGTFARVFANGVSAAVSFSGFHADGQRRLFYPELSALTRTGGVAEGLDADRYSHLFGALTVGHWTMRTVWGSRTKQIPTGSFETAFDDDRSRTRDLRGYVDASFERSWRGASIQWRGAYDRYFYDGTYAREFDEGPDPDPFADNSRGDWLSTEGTIRRQVSSAHHLTAGFEFRDNVRQNQWGVYSTSGAVALDARHRSHAWALFAQDEFRLAPRVLLNAGIRHDDVAFSGAATSPRAALIVSARQDAAFKLTYGEAFRAPNAFELFYYAPGPKPLREERIRSSEIIWEQYVARRVRVQGTIFFNAVRNLISQQPGESDTPLEEASFQNLDSTAARGAGIEAEARVTPRINLHGSYQYQRARLRGADSRLSNSPANLARAAATYRSAGGRVTASTELLAVGRRLALNGTASSAFALWNASIAAPVALPHVTLQLDVRNIVDTQYGDPGAEEHRQALIPQDGRTVRLRATWRF